MRKLLIFALLAFVGCKETEEPLTQKAIEGEWKPEYIYQDFYNADLTLILPTQQKLNSGYGVRKFKEGKFSVETTGYEYSPISFWTEKDSILVIDYGAVKINPDGTLSQPILVTTSTDGSRGSVYYKVEGDTLSIYNRFTIDEPMELEGIEYLGIMTVLGEKYSRIK